MLSARYFKVHPVDKGQVHESLKKENMREKKGGRGAGEREIQQKAQKI